MFKRRRMNLVACAVCGEIPETLDPAKEKRPRKWPSVGAGGSPLNSGGGTCPFFVRSPKIEKGGNLRDHAFSALRGGEGRQEARCWLGREDGISGKGRREAPPELSEENPLAT